MFSQTVSFRIYSLYRKALPVLANKENRALAGLSMGALQTQITSVNNPGLFDYMGVFSIGLQMELGEVTTDLIKAYDTNLAKIKQNNYKLFI
jgi:enterochelin esterase family protein